MPKLSSRIALSGILLLALAAVPAQAQKVIPAGKDVWVTPANGQTFFTFPDGDVESLCGAAASSSWTHQIALQGVPMTGADWDTMVQRLDNAVFNTSGVATTRAQVAYLAFNSTSTTVTPCGRLYFGVGLAGSQPVTTMTFVRSTAGGGLFHADIAVSVEIKAYEIHHGDYIGSLFYSFVLPNPSTGTPWSIGPNGEFRPGMTTTNNCVDVLRQKLSQYSTTSSHYYYISDMIAQGNCSGHP
jgi:predicted lipoprotein with Yx(FWY)xxD motif